VGISRNPLTLLKCLSKYRITYTFSPNFLLAAILRDLPHASFDEPVDLSNLRAFISGGEAVPVETAIAFADMMEEKFGARRDVLQSAYGMTETVGGFTYDIRTTPKADTPDGPKYLSVGKCCQGAEVRIVKRDTGKLCLPGETGKLQIRGPIIFTEYYGNEPATAQSFTSDGWFTTGDLAQLDGDGNLYIVGRDKDFLNINGVKHPAQDVEHYIEDAGIQGVMPSYICVCPMRLADADTETYGVFYQHEFVVEAGLDSMQKDAIRAANRSIKAACTMFCSQVPHIVLPLPRKYFAKTALGKVSRSQLSQAYLVGEFDDVRAMLETQDNVKRDDASDILVNPVPGVVADIISTTFSVDISSLRRSQSVFDMGATSMHLLRMKQAMQERLSLPKLPTMEMLKRTKVGELCDYLTELVQAQKRGANKAAVEYDPIIRMNPSGSKPPLFLIHPGVCDVLVFVALARQLGDDRPVYALRARGFDNNETPFNTWNEMIECYTSSIERVSPNGPYYIAGYSYGGAMAFEIAKSLESKGKSVPFLGILNLPPYFQFFVPELNWAEVAFYLAQFLSIIPLSEVGPMQKEIQKAFPELALNDTKPLNPRGPISWLFERLDEKRFMDLDLDVGAITTWVNVIFELRRIGRTYVPQGRVKNALMSVFCAAPLHMVRMGRQEYKDDKLSMWKEFSGPRFEMIDVDGEHGSMLSEENVVSFSAHMRAALRRAELGE
jgi:thioesterase domain-containing protein